MCGIVGVFNYKNNIQHQYSFVEWALQRMHHRGPDSNRIWTNNENYITGFVRLAIRDLSDNGNQPMLSADGRYAVSFNGELYNTDQYKKDLQKQGYQFKSSTDTEVLLYGLIHWGVRFVLENFDGIFAFAFYNFTSNTLILARDRAGIKPLYVGASAQGIVYSSQYDHIINHEYIINNSINPAALGSYLNLGYVTENSGVINHTFLLPHGYYLNVTSKGYTQHRFYNYALDVQPAQSLSLEEILEQSVKEQLVSDVPVGTFMSGGVDSPLVSYYARKHHHIQSFTIGVDDERMDESKAAQEYADIFKTRHYCKHITGKDLLETIKDNTMAFSEPFSDYSSIPTLILSKFARQSVTVALSGDGGDELFWGYPRNLRMLNEGNVFRYNRLMRLLKLTVQKMNGANKVIRKRHLQVSDFPAYYYRSLFITGAEQFLPQLYKCKSEDAYFLKELYKERNAKAIGDNDIMNTLRKLEFDIHLQRILIKVDRASMFHSLEVRVPLLSNQMINYSNTLYYKDCIKNGQGKANLKALLASKANERLVCQPKKGFIIPIGAWLRNELKADVENKLMNMPGDFSYLFDKNEIIKILRQHNNNSKDWGWLIWSLYSLINWNEAHRNVR